MFEAGEDRRGVAGSFRDRRFLDRRLFDRRLFSHNMRDGNIAEDKRTSASNRRMQDRRSGEDRREAG